MGWSRSYAHRYEKTFVEVQLQYPNTDRWVHYETQRACPLFRIPATAGSRISHTRAENSNEPRERVLATVSANAKTIKPRLSARACGCKGRQFQQRETQTGPRNWYRQRFERGFRKRDRFEAVSREGGREVCSREVDSRRRFERGVVSREREGETDRRSIA